MRCHICVVVSCLAACAAPGEPPTTIDHSSTPIVGDLVAGDYELALERADRALLARPRSAWLLYNRGVALAGLGRVPEALEMLREAEHGFQLPRERAIAAYRRALILELAGRCEESAAEYGHYAALAANTDPSLVGAAHIHVSFCVAPTARQEALRQETAQLRDAYNDRVRQQVELASTGAVRALTRFDFEVALAQADIGLSVAPDDPWLLYNRGSALAELDRTKEALKTLREAERRFPAAEKHGRAVATYRRALALEVAGRCDEAGQELDHYAQLVGPSEPKLAAHTAAHLRFCRYAQQRPVARSGF